MKQHKDNEGEANSSTNNHTKQLASFNMMSLHSHCGIFESKMEIMMKLCGIIKSKKFQKN